MDDSFSIRDLALLLPREQAETRTPEDEVLFLFDTTRSGLLRYALSFGISLHDAEDVLQEAFLALFHHLRRGRPRHNLHGWLFRVTHHLALRRRMRNSKLVGGDDTFAEALADSALNPEAQFLFAERERCLLAVFRALPQRERQCLQLRAEGLTYREIARIVGISLGSVSSSIARAVARLATADHPQRSPR